MTGQRVVATPDPSAHGVAVRGSRRFGWGGIAALGIVFGDIGTSPLYAMQATFAAGAGDVTAMQAHVYGVVSIVFWSLLLIVSCKYVLIVLRADHHGEGGILALATLAHTWVSGRRRLAAAVSAAGIVGACLFFGDSVITPAISVMSAVEGLRVAAPDMPDLVVPMTVVILVALFALQRRGTARVGGFFGPFMLVWFVVIAALGIPHLVASPQILGALNPAYAFGFITDNPFGALVALSAIVLVVTGAEALYADLGHFGRRTIRRAWLVVVFPALLVHYLGQGAHVAANPDAIRNPFFTMAPAWAALPLVVLATIATIIASQSVISGAYSVAMQAMRLGLLPRLTVRHTSALERGQVYLPLVNLVLMLTTIAVVLLFQSSSALAAAYGFAVTITFVVTTVLILVVARRAWNWPIVACVVVGGVLLTVELTYVAANALKFFSGAWLPLVVGTTLLIVMTTWRLGRREVDAQRAMREGALRDYLRQLRDNMPHRVPGTAVYLHASATTSPLAFRTNTRFNRVLHERCFFVRIVTAEAAHVPPAEQATIVPITDAPPGLFRVTLRLGFFDPLDVPQSLARVVAENGVGEFNPNEVAYVLTRLRLHPLHARGLAAWRRQLFIWLARAAASPSDHYRLPPTRTLEVTTAIQV